MKTIPVEDKKYKHLFDVLDSLKNKKERVTHPDGKCWVYPISIILNSKIELVPQSMFDEWVA